jgi:hypothetical protein
MRTKKVTHLIPERRTTETETVDGITAEVDVGHKDEFSDGLNVSDAIETMQYGVTVWNYSYTNFTDNEATIISDAVCGIIRNPDTGDRYIDTAIVITSVDGCGRDKNIIDAADCIKCATENALRKL